jgi:excisionase family DNA binding protein
MAADERKTEWLTKDEAAKYLGVTLGWIREAMERGRIPYYKFGHYVRFRREDLDEYIAENRRVGMAQR